MRHIILAATLLFQAGALPAQPVTEGLRAMLARLPDMAGLSGAEIAYGDMAAARALSLSILTGAIDGASSDPDIAQLRAMPAGPLANTLRNPATAWRGAVGFGPIDVAQILVLTAPPNAAMLLQLVPGAGAAVAPALAAAGYAAQTQSGLTAWTRGEDLQIDLAGRNPEDPFGFGMGMASRVQIEQDLLRQSRDWPTTLALATAAQRPMLARPDIAALVAAVDDAPGALMMAVIYPEGGIFGMPDPITAMPGQPETVWTSALFADLSSGARSTGVLAIGVILADVAAAEALRARVAQAWAERPSDTTGTSFAEMTTASAEVTIHDTGNRLWVLRISAETATGVHATGQTQNTVFARLIDGMMRRDLVFLQP